MSIIKDIDSSNLAHYEVSQSEHKTVPEKQNQAGLVKQKIHFVKEYIISNLLVDKIQKLNVTSSIP